MSGPVLSRTKLGGEDFAYGVLLGEGAYARVSVFITIEILIYLYAIIFDISITKRPLQITSLPYLSFYHIPLSGRSCTTN